MKKMIGFFIGLTLALLLTLFAGENPIQILMILGRSAFGSVYDLGLTLSYTAPLIFCGLSVAIAFHAGMFNIGAEGQLTIATVSAAAFGVLLPQIPFPFAPIAALVFALFMASMWGLIAGYLKAYRQSHEVIVTMMLNFIAAGLANWFTLHIIPNPNSQNPETAVIQPQYFLKDIDLVANFFQDTPANNSIIIAIVLCFVIWFILWKTPWGYELRAVGSNPTAARRAGINENKIRIQAMMLSAALAGFVAYSEVLGSQGQYRIGFSPDYGFIGIAVALLASNNPLAIIPAAFMMAALHKGASDLDLETNTITRDFSKIIQAFVILGVAANALYTWHKNKKRSES